jgi:predicted CXXCH cytochrome family protein
MKTFLALVVMLVLAAPSIGWSGDPDVLCELARADRARTSSFACIACHDGSIAAAVSLKDSASVGLTHPVEVSYREAAAKGNSRLTPIAQMPPSLVLVEGNVACVTCHDPKSKREHHLAMPMAGSALCLSCHPY